jgi:hypothetical protein
MNTNLLTQRRKGEEQERKEMGFMNLGFLCALPFFFAPLR